jgi:beta-glucosidase
LLNIAAELGVLPLSPSGGPFVHRAAAGDQVDQHADVNSDGWVLEHLPHTLSGEPSGDAWDFLHRYPG